MKFSAALLSVIFVSIFSSLASMPASAINAIPQKMTCTQNLTSPTVQASFSQTIDPQQFKMDEQDLDQGSTSPATCSFEMAGAVTLTVDGKVYSLENNGTDFVDGGVCAVQSLDSIESIHLTFDDAQNSSYKILVHIYGDNLITIEASNTLYTCSPRSLAR